MASQTVAQCECSDPGCPVHRGVSDCREPARQTLRRVDMVDRTGTRFCAACAADALESGLY